jgi:2-oxoglutarate ferredoxin oxidoreductase subunit delta
MAQKMKEYLHSIRDRYCKGCNICVAFCPKQVLALKGGKVFAEKPELCIGCTMCELRCPDFAIEVRPKAEAVAAEPSRNGAMDFIPHPESHHA